MTNTVCALIIIALVGAYLMAEAIVDAFRDANRTIDLVIALCTTDPIDAHFDSIPAECTPIHDQVLAEMQVSAEAEEFLREVAG